VPLQRILDLTEIPFLHRLAPELEEVNVVEEVKVLKYNIAMQNRVGLQAEAMDEPACEGARDEGGLAQRGDRYDGDYVKSRPEGKDKIGKKGNVIPIKANYYEVKTAPTWALYKYRVDFTPALDQSFLRMQLFKTAAKGMEFGSMYDGTMLYTPREFTENRDPNDAVILNVESEEGTQYDIKIKGVGQVETGSPTYLSFYNRLLRRCKDAMHMVEMQPYFLDPSAAIDLPTHSVQLWPGKLSRNIMMEISLLLLKCNLQL